MKKKIIALEGQSFADVLASDLSKDLNVFDGDYSVKSCKGSIYVYTKTGIFTCYLINFITHFCFTFGLTFCLFIEQENSCSGLVTARPCIEIKLS